MVDAPSSAARRGAGGLFRLRPAAVQPSAICGLGYFTAWNIRIVPVVIRRVGGGAPRLPRCWPPSAAQTWCAVFPDHAFTKVPCWHSWFQQSPFLHRERSTAPDGPTSSPFLGRPRGVDVYGCSEQSENGNRPQSPHTPVWARSNTVHLTILIRLEMSMRRVHWRWRGRRL